MNDMINKFREYLDMREEILLHGYRILLDQLEQFESTPEIGSVEEELIHRLNKTNAGILMIQSIRINFQKIFVKE